VIVSHSAKAVIAQCGQSVASEFGAKFSGDHTVRQTKAVRDIDIAKAGLADHLYDRVAKTPRRSPANRV
jgi:hypothetical protein